MKPSEVPDDLVQAAIDVLTGLLSPEGLAYAPASWWTDDVRKALAAVLPLHEQQLRAAIGAELQRLAAACAIHPDPLHYDPQCVRCHRHAAIIGAARIASGENKGPQT